ncbi:hypothetical protein [Legionella worsleiensis]|uniref:Uncharacterized protein n=1 Tax=Legionella worsleiensis TaxID=45076 RepID=A0A0W1AA92_9GAMM|nr:hypothetical protein [Legionella worsleiensis]KTD78262.1 hypothetical protein Lwor_1657 [Legionella worsleiensis]STY32599.1 Uncharacterised protein [Legionella worsleiensis]
MTQLLIPDFIKNRMVQYLLILSSFMDAIVSGTLKHILVLIGLPYLTSVALSCLLPPRKAAVKRRISEQYRPLKKLPQEYS